MTQQAGPPSDPLIEEVRDRRRRLYVACGQNLQKLAEAIQRREAEHPEKVVDRRKRAAKANL
ncbi:MAG: hypothetical protein KAY37_03775 [Phycisphaerae bacterium]|nr:hypothetical protein [Phycisphaerae bacterium]